MSTPNQSRQCFQAITRAIVAEHSVGLAVGVVMERRGVAPSQALHLLVEESRLSRQPLGLVASRVIALRDL